MATNSAWKLDDHPKLPKGKTIALIVLDGWGESAPDEYNCIHTAPTPTMDSLKNVCTLLSYSYRLLELIKLYVRFNINRGLTIPVMKSLYISQSYCNKQSN